MLIFALQHPNPPYDIENSRVTCSMGSNEASKPKRNLPDRSNTPLSFILPSDSCSTHSDVDVCENALSLSEALYHCKQRMVSHLGL